MIHSLTKWVIGIRFAVAILCMILYAVQRRFPLPILFLIILIVYNLFLALPILRRMKQLARDEVAILVDFLPAISLVHATGGLESAFTPLLYLPLLEAALFLPFTVAVTFALMVVGVLLALYGSPTATADMLSIPRHQRLVEVTTAMLLLNLAVGAIRSHHRNRISQLETERTALRDLADHDPLTGALNRRAFMNRIETEIARAERSGEAMALVLIDVDDLKTINDELGHNAGDVALVRLTEHLIECSRRHDVICRYGGDEFALLLPNTDHRGAAQWMNRVRSRKDQSLPHFSAGGALYPNAARDITALIRMADEALYQAKSALNERRCQLEDGEGEIPFPFLVTPMS